MFVQIFCKLEKFMLKTSRTRILYAFLFIVALLLLTSLPDRVRAASSITVNGATTFQTIDGFGASAHFGIASLIKNLPGATTVMDDLFSTTKGAGLSIVRNGIGPSSIEPNNPGSPTTAPSYTWDGSDSQQ